MLLNPSMVTTSIDFNTKANYLSSETSDTIDLSLEYIRLAIGL